MSIVSVPIVGLGFIVPRPVGRLIIGNDDARFFVFLGCVAPNVVVFIPRPSPTLRDFETHVGVDRMYGLASTCNQFRKSTTVPLQNTSACQRTYSRDADIVSIHHIHHPLV